MDGPRDNYTEWSKSDRKRQIGYQLYVKSKKNCTNELIYKREIGIENKFMVTKGLKREGGIN